MAEKDVFAMKEPFDDKTVDFEDAYDELDERHKAQWGAMTPEEKAVYEKVFDAIVPDDSEEFVSTAIPENYFRDRSVEELQSELKEKYGIDVQLSERLRTAMQDFQDWDKYLSVMIAFADE